jgi:hypothetical protein
MSLPLQRLINSAYTQAHEAGLSNSWVYLPGNPEDWTSGPGTNKQKKESSARTTNRVPDSILNRRLKFTHSWS